MLELTLRLSVVLPVFRTVAMLDELWRRLTATIETAGLSYELIFVDDASPDGAGVRIGVLAEADPHVVQVSHSTNLGQRAAVWSGLRVARGEVVVIMDADLQDRPEDIPLLLEELSRGGCEAVFAGRRGAYQSGVRMKTSRLFKRSLAWLLGVPDDAGSFVAMSRAMVSSVLGLPPSRLYMLALIASTGLPVRSIPVTRSSRPNGESAYTEMARLRFAVAGLLTAVELRWKRWTIQ